MLAAPPKAEQQRPQPRLTYRPALDGVRALAVAVVFAYHANMRWAKAGFIGVDVFFVLSGYLITALLLGERRREGRIDLVRFWKARARRLLPALFVVLAAVAITVPLLAGEQAYRLRSDLLASLGYVMNWRLIFAHQSYFQSTGRPPVLQHLWSLAVEEQFYLLWPPILWLILRTKPMRRLVKPLLLAAVASTVLMVVLFQPYADPSRVYYGTDTRAAALLVGAALACATTRWQLVDWLPRSGLIVLEVAGIIALAGLGWAVSHVNEFDPMLYRGGFLAIALLAAALVGACARPGPSAVLGTALGCRPMVWLGQRSYAIYLWFWPVLLFTRERDVPASGPALLAVRVGLTLALAALSYRFVEKPVRAGALGRFWDDVHRARTTGQPVRSQTALLGLGLSGLLACVGAGVVVGHDAVKPNLVLSQASGLNSSVAATLADPVAPAGTGADSSTSTTPAAPTAVIDPPTTEAPATTIPSLPTVSMSVTAIGDSVMLGAKVLLEHQVEGIVVDASVGRQFPALLSTVRSYRDSAKLGEDVVIHTGNNGPITTSQFEQLLDALKGVPRVVVLNVKVDRGWQDPNNEVIAGTVPRYPNTVLVDWHYIASHNPDAFYEDGLHLTPAGIRLYAQSVLSTL